jgi:hypothetical protein
MVEDSLKSRIIQESDTQPHGFTQALDIPGIVEVAVVHGRLDDRVS